MKKIFLMCLLLCLGSKVYAIPNQTMSIAPVAVDAATIEAVDENTRNNAISTPYNAHGHDDLTQTTSTSFLFMSGTDSGTNGTLKFGNSTNVPAIRWNGTLDAFQYTEDQSTWITLPMAQGSADRFLVSQGANQIPIWPENPTLDGSLSISQDLTISGTMLVSGDLTVSGTTATLPTETTIGTSTEGDIYYNNGTYIDSLARGSNNDTLVLSAGLPAWTAAAGSDVIFTWSGIEGYAASDTGGYIGTSLTAAVGDIGGYLYFLSDIETYTTFLNFKFKKTADVDAVTIYARIWTDGNITATLNVDIGGQSNTVTKTNQATPVWATASDIDVSGLTLDTVYDGIVQLKSSNATDKAYCIAVTLIGKP